MSRLQRVHCPRLQYVPPQVGTYQTSRRQNQKPTKWLQAAVMLASLVKEPFFLFWYSTLK